MDASLNIQHKRRLIRLVLGMSDKEASIVFADFFRFCCCCVRWSIFFLRSMLPQPSSSLCFCTLFPFSFFVLATHLLFWFSLFAPLWRPFVAIKVLENCSSFSVCAKCDASTFKKTTLFVDYGRFNSFAKLWKYTENVNGLNGDEDEERWERRIKQKKMLFEIKTTWSDEDHEPLPVSSSSSIQEKTIFSFRFFLSFWVKYAINLLSKQ